MSENEGGATFFAYTMSVCKVELFAFYVDEIAFFVNDESTIVLEVAIGPLVVIATEEMDAGTLLCFLAKSIE